VIWVDFKRCSVLNEKKIEERKVDNIMKKNWHSSFAVIVVAFLLAPMISAPVAIAGVSGLPQPVESRLLKPMETLAIPQVTLEEAILIVKSNFDVPIEYTDFNSTYNTYDDRQVWALRWNGTAERPGEFAAEVSAINGNIISMNYWKNDTQVGNSPSIPPITKLAAREISNNLLKRLLGKLSEDLRLIPSDSEIMPLDYSPVNYNLQYQRLIDGVPFLSNGANVQVSSTDGHITSYNLNWNEVKAPEGKGVINSTQAQQAFIKAPFFKLEYWVPSSYRPLVAGQKQVAKLVYQLRGQNGGAIDAFTGEPLQLNQGDWLMTDSFGTGGMGNAKEERAGSISDGAQVLTPQEQLEVERTAKLLKRDEAIAAVQRWIEIPANLTLRSANLGTDWRSADKRIWSFNWNSMGSDKGDGTPQYLSARVSATTGELYGFDISNQPSGKTEAKLDRLAAQNLAEEFLKKVQPDRFSQVVLNTEINNQMDKISPEPWNIQAYSYHRVVNGVDFPDNGMIVNVDPVAGKVTSYELNWSEHELSSVSGILSKEQAVESFLKARPLTLNYVRIYSNGMPGDLRLVYLPVSQDRSISISNILDAKSGELLDYQGLPLEKGPKPYNFTDLEGVNGASEIAALGQAGLFGDYGNSFKPLEKMNLGSLLRAMYLNRFGQWGNTGLTESEILKKAKEQGWLKEEMQPGDPVSREILVKVLLRYIQLDKLAELNDIYQVKFQDAAQINPDALGFFALASSTGILKVEGQVLAPLETVSRAEAATALFRALGWRK